MDTTSVVTLPEFFGKSCDWYDVPCHTTSALKWFGDFAGWLPLKIVQMLCEGLASVVSSIPAPAWIASAGANLGAISPYVVFFADAFQIGQGLAIIFAAYQIRWAIRRLPFVG